MKWSDITSEVWLVIAKREAILKTKIIIKTEEKIEIFFTKFGTSVIMLKRVEMFVSFSIC